MSIKKRLYSIILTLTLALSLTPAANAEILVLGDEDFAVDTIEGYTYYTRDSDLSEADSVVGYMFEYSDNYVCYVKGKGNFAFIEYFPTSNNSGLSHAQKIGRCLELNFSDDAGFFDSIFMVVPEYAGYMFYQSTKDASGSNAKYYHYYYYAFLEHGVVVISSNSTNDESVRNFVISLYDSIMASKANNFV